MSTDLSKVFAGRRVFVTGHTGFKGSWLALWLRELGAEVYGFALEPGTEPNLFSVIELQPLLHHQIADVRDLDALRSALRCIRPDFVFHLAAQSLVRRSYEDPLTTIQTNIVGTTNLLEAIRLERQRCAVVIVTSDKCYENRETARPYREGDPLGGHDVYSMSKGAVELVVASYRRSFFAPSALSSHGVGLASARAGNVIGGGDWAPDRIVPDVIESLTTGKCVEVRNPSAIRPWQHVLEPLSGYLLLAANLSSGSDENRARYCEAWNFGPRIDECTQVRDLVERFIAAWGTGEWVEARHPDAAYEAAVLTLDTAKAASSLQWRPRWHLDEAVQRTAAWYRAHHEHAPAPELRKLCIQQITDYVGDAT